MDQHQLRAAHRQLADGPADPRRRGQGLPDRDHPQHRHLPGCVPVPAEARVGVEGQGPPRLPRPPPRPSTGCRPRYARQIFHSVKAPHRMTSVQAGEVEAVHAVTTANVWEQQGVVGRGPDRHPDHGPPLHQPLQRQLDPQPDPGGLPRPRLLLQPLPGQAAGARGRRADHDPPDPVGVQPGPPPELHRLLRAGAEPRPPTRRHVGAVRGGLRHRPVVHPPLPDRPRLPRGPPVLHVVLVRPRPRAPRRGHHRRAATRRPCTGSASAPPRPWPTPSRWPRDVVGPSPTLTHLHAPPILMADVQ